MNAADADTEVEPLTQYEGESDPDAETELVADEQLVEEGHSE